MKNTHVIGIYGVPEMSMVGATEQELTAKKIPYNTGTAHLWETARGQIMGLEEGTLKMIFSTKDQGLLGVHILGEGAAGRGGTQYLPGLPRSCGVFFGYIFQRWTPPLRARFGER